jgi:hypothetical protein
MSEQIEIKMYDIASLADKLEALSAGLNDQERALLAHVLRAAAENTDEVSGYATASSSSGFGGDLTVRVGFVESAPKQNAPAFFRNCVAGAHYKKVSLEL